MSRVQARSRQVACMSNLRQVAGALLAYGNHGMLPSPSQYDPSTWRPEDWVFWQVGRDPARSSIVPYLGNNGAALGVLRCPSDDVAVHPSGPAGGYPYSYGTNHFLVCR